MNVVRLTAATAVVALAATGAVLTSSPAQAAKKAGKAAKPDTACMKAGIKTLQGAGLLDDVARGGLPIADAVALGVAPRSADLDLSTLPDPLPLSLVLADHRAGSSSLFVYPWC